MEDDQDIKTIIADRDKWKFAAMSLKDQEFVIVRLEKQIESLKEQLATAQRKLKNAK